MTDQVKTEMMNGLKKNLLAWLRNFLFGPKKNRRLSGFLLMPTSGANLVSKIRPKSVNLRRKRVLRLTYGFSECDEIMLPFKYL